MLPLDRQNALRQQYRRSHPHWQPATEVYAGLVRSNLSPDSRVLDLGCGRGGLVEQLDHPLMQMFGLDPDHFSLRRHRLPLPGAQAYSHRLPFAAHSFDLVFASWLLEHLARPQDDVTEIARVLRPGGAFIFITPNARHPLAYINRLLGRLGALQARLVQSLYARAGTDTFPTTYRANDHATLTRLAANAGLRLQSLAAIPDPTYVAFTPTLFRAAQWLDSRLPQSRQLHLVGLMRCLETREPETED